jgi:prevent-host-death family protein
MVMKKVSIQDLKARLSAVVAEAEEGRTIVVTRHNEPVGQLGPARMDHGRRGAKRTRLRPAITRGSKGRYLKVLAEDRGDR